MNPYAPYFTMAALAAVALMGVGGGYWAADAASRVRVERCASDIAKGETADCPVPIQTGFKALGLKAAEKEIEYRDRVIPVIVQGQTEDRVARQALLASINALNKMERTYACAASPAFQLRRSQLLADAEAPADPDQPQADASPG